MHYLTVIDELTQIKNINPIKVRQLLKRRGVQNAEQLSYHFTITALAKLIVEDIKKGRSNEQF